MKSPDITLFLQAIHFFIAYYVLRTYVFYPGMRILEKEESKGKKLRDDIEQASIKNDQVEQDKQSRWSRIKQALHSLTPDVSLKLFSLQSSQDKDDLLHDKKEKISDAQRAKVKKIVFESLSDVKE